MGQIGAIVSIACLTVAVVAYLFVSTLIVSLGADSRRTLWVLAANLVSALWSAALIGFVVWPGFPLSLLSSLDAVYLTVWVLCVCVLWRGIAPADMLYRMPGLVAGVAVLLLAVVLAIQAIGFASAPAETDQYFAYVALLGTALCGLIAVEQLYRNSEYAARRAWLPMSIALGSIFAVNVFVFAQAVLFDQMLGAPWVARAVVTPFAAPAILLSLKRQQEWESELFVSRHVVFYTASFTAVGLYLIAMALGASLIGMSDQAWGGAAQFMFLVFTALVLAYVIFSSRLRDRLRVFIAKHFYRNKYDYREEWLRIISTLAGARSRLSPEQLAIRALADIIGSPRGELWLSSPHGGGFEAKAAYPGDRPERDIDADDPVADFLVRRQWVIDTLEYTEDPELYEHAFARVEDELRAHPSIYVPLVHEAKLIGIVRLARPSGMPVLDYEDHDLLKTAGQQAAIFLEQERSKDELSQTRQFEAFSRLTTFLMHDLKNLIAQQELVVANAKRFGNRPGFLEDAIGTLESGVQRMRRVLGRLQAGLGSEQVSQVSLAQVVRDVCLSCADREPVPVVHVADESLSARINREKLSMAIAHAIRNAQDATDTGGRIDVRVAAADGQALIEIADTGVGMDDEFIRSRLFRPFDSTKGAQGMGIGAHQIRDTLRAAGGDVVVDSEPGKGTRMTCMLPLAAEVSEA